MSHRTVFYIFTAQCWFLNTGFDRFGVTVSDSTFTLLCKLVFMEFRMIQINLAFMIFKLHCIGYHTKSTTLYCNMEDKPMNLSIEKSKGSNRV